MGNPGVFANAGSTRSLVNGEVLFAEGDVGKEMYGVISGSVELFHYGVTVARVGPGETFGELAIIDAAPRSLSAIAIDFTELAVIDHDTFIALVDETPSFAIHVMRSLSNWIRLLDVATGRAGDRPP